MVSFVILMLSAASHDAVAVANLTEDPKGEIVIIGTRLKDDYAVKGSNAAKIDAPLRDIPQTIDVVSAAVLRDQRALSVQDALKNVPGVGFSTGDGQRDQVSIRGFSAIADQFVDGFRDDALYFRDLSNVDRIEVIKGPAAVLYGRGSSGGLINRVTRKPGVDITAGTLTIGSFDAKRGEADLGRAGDLVSWRATGAIERSDSYRDGQFLNRETLAPSLLFRPGAATEVLLQADYLRDKRLTDFGIPAFQGRPGRSRSWHLLRRRECARGRLQPLARAVADRVADAPFLGCSVVPQRPAPLQL